MSLQTFLDNKPLYYTEIDYTRMPRVYEKIKSQLPSSNIIHLIGTNGKGTTGRFLATALYTMGYKTAHYTSPHILEFNERVWINGENASYDSLELAHKKLQTILTKKDSDSLSYFEYTTFLAMLLFEGCEYIIMEAGLGGEHDATAVFQKLLTLVTPIDYDHESFLGSDIKSIATTKLHAINKNAIIATQKYEEVYSVAKEMKDKNIYKLDEFITSQDRENIKIISKNLALANYLSENLKLSIAALNFLNLEYKIEDFKESKLFGRLSKVGKNILVDVGHNPLAALEISKALVGEKYTLIYNTYKDKEYKNILEILKPIIKELEILELNDERIVTKENLHRTLTDLEIQYASFKKIKKDKNYLVFGSFRVVEEFLRVYNG